MFDNVKSGLREVIGLASQANVAFDRLRTAQQESMRELETRVAAVEERATAVARGSEQALSAIQGKAAEVKKAIEQDLSSIMESISHADNEAANALDDLIDRLRNAKNIWDEELDLALDALRAGGLSMREFLSEYGEIEIEIKGRLVSLREYLADIDPREFTNKIQEIMQQVQKSSTDLEAILNRIGALGGQFAEMIVEMVRKFQEGQITFDELARRIEELQRQFPDSDLDDLLERPPGPAAKTRKGWTDMSPAVPGNAFLDRRELRTPTSQWKIGREEFRTVRRNATGDAREILAYQDPDLPLLKVKRSFTLSWPHVESSTRETIEELIGIPGIHELVLWRHEQLVWRGNGVRTVFRLPSGWILATDTVAPPDGLPSAKFRPTVKVGLDGTFLDVETGVADAVFDDGDPPPAGFAWFRGSGSDLRLDAAPPSGEYLFARVVPVYRVLRATANREKVLSRPTVEPEDLQLLEV